VLFCLRTESAYSTSKQDDDQREWRLIGRLGILKIQSQQTLDLPMGKSLGMAIFRRFLPENSLIKFTVAFLS
jgi:hypothetical protein